MNAQIVDLARAAHTDREQRIARTDPRRPGLRRRWGARIVRWGERIGGFRAGAPAAPRPTRRMAMVGLG